jgi:hypothetical protein
MQMPTAERYARCRYRYGGTSYAKRGRGHTAGIGWGPLKLNQASMLFYIRGGHGAAPTYSKKLNFPTEAPFFRLGT